MAQKKTVKKIKDLNSVHVRGYLKENNLKHTETKSGEPAISGSIMIAVNETTTTRVGFYVAKYSKTGEVNKRYEDIQSLIDNGVSIADHLKETPNMTFDEAKEVASKVWAQGNLDEYLTVDGERENSNVSVRGFSAGIIDGNSDKEFIPEAKFEIGGYIESMVPEKTYESEEDEEGTETGRLLITLLTPKYDKSVSRIEFVAPTDNNIAAYIAKNYHTTDTVKIVGHIVDTFIREENEEVEDETDTFGEEFSKGPQFTTLFIHERVISGGIKTPIKMGDTDSVTKKEAKEGLEARLNRGMQNAERAKKRAQEMPNDSTDGETNASSDSNSNSAFSDPSCDF